LQKPQVEGGGFRKLQKAEVEGSGCWITHPLVVVIFVTKWVGGGGEFTTVLFIFICCRVAMKFIVHHFLLVLVISSLILRCIFFLLEKVKNGVELSHTLQWKGVQVLNNIISYSGEFIMCTMTCEELKGEKNEIVVCNKYFVKM